MSVKEFWIGLIEVSRLTLMLVAPLRGMGSWTQKGESEASMAVSHVSAS